MVQNENDKKDDTVDFIDSSPINITKSPPKDFLESSMTQASFKASPSISEL